MKIVALSLCVVSADTSAITSTDIWGSSSASASTVPEPKASLRGSSTGGIWGTSAQSLPPPASESIYRLGTIAQALYQLNDGIFDLQDCSVRVTGTQCKLEEALNADTGGYKVIVESIRHDQSAGNCKMAVWTNGANTVLGIKGTDMANPTDLGLDAALTWGGAVAIAAFRPTVDTALELIATYSVGLITGHSLGGYAAEIIATHNNVRGIAFCAPGTNSPRGNLGGQVVTGFHNVNWEYDAVVNTLNTVTDFWPISRKTHVQWQIFVWTGGHLFFKHQMEDLLVYFADKEDITNDNVQARSEWRWRGGGGYYYPK